MTTYIVPCGVSIIAGLSDAAYAPNMASRRLGNALDSWCARGRSGAELVSEWFTALKGPVEKANLAKWKPGVSAETSTLHAGAVSSSSERLAGGDRILLLASDTDVGKAAALAVAYHLTDGTSELISATAAPPDPDAARCFGRDLKASRGKVTVAVVGGLEPGTSSLPNAIGAIGLGLREAFDVEPTSAVEVHLTGGFKLTLLHILAMTEVLHSLAPQRVRARYLFEGSSKTTGIGLRRFPRDYLSLMRRDLTNVKYGSREVTETFEGIAWDAAPGGKKVLNAFGQGYLSVLGGPVSSGTADGAQ